MKTKVLIKVILICILFFGIFLFFNLTNFQQFESDKVSYNTSVKRVGAKEYTTDIQFSYEVTHGQERSFLIYVNKGSLKLTCQNIKGTNKITVKIKDKSGRLVYEKDIGDGTSQKIKIANLKEGEYKIIIVFRKGFGEGRIKIE
ncbi:DUF3244 domain-containing protein [Caldicellulosiruptor acetigenus]|uniref:Uncharacterized protein n=1 Tax=Caldicellulosiruptor acetigenus 6A TaxID=632516 RepID=G2PYH8_9FIRM|nr:DUF3244 domain-containing protein [Caldicellulosiruptor acetigenus]AEM74028.1 hypothetical protein Calla_1410 [Caldicellulosiruptor acetigenus 6A]